MATFFPTSVHLSTELHHGKVAFPENRKWSSVLPLGHRAGVGVLYVAFGSLSCEWEARSNNCLHAKRTPPVISPKGSVHHLFSSKRWRTGGCWEGEDIMCLFPSAQVWEAPLGTNL